MDSLMLSMVRMGSQSALSRVIDKYTGYVCTIVHNAASSLSREDVEETAADVFFALWENAQDVDKLKPWLAAVARNKAKNRVRVLRDAHEPLEDEALPAAGNPAEDALIDEFEQTSVRSAVENLKSPDREIFRMHYYEELTVAAIAEKTGLTESAVKHRLVRGRKKLGKMLIEKEVF